MADEALSGQIAAHVKRKPISSGPITVDSASGRVVSIALLGLLATAPLANALTLDVGFPLTVGHLFALVLAGGLLWHDRGRPRIVTWLPITLFGAFLVVYAASFAANSGADLQREDWATGRFAPGIRSLTKVLWLGGNITIALIVANAVRRLSWEQRAMQALAIGALVVGAYGVYQVVGETHGFYVPLLPSTEFIQGSPQYWVVLRARSTFLEPSFLGGFLAVALPMIAVAWLDREPTKPRRILTMAALVLASASIIVTFAIGGWLPAAVGVVILVALAGRGHRIPILARVAVASILALLVVAIAVPNVPRAMSVLLYKGALGSGVVAEGPARTPGPSTSPTASEEPDLDELPPEVAAVSAAERSATTRAALNMWTDHPVLGVGPGNFGLRYREYRAPGVAEPTQLLIANNVYAELLAETGILGLLAFVGGAGALVVLALRAWSRSRAARRLRLAAGVAALSATAAYFLLSPTFTMLYQWAIAGLVAAFVSSATPSQTAESTQEDPAN